MKTPTDFSDLANLALHLKNSDDTEVARLAQGFLALEANYGELRHAYIGQTAELVMRRHEHLLKRLAKHDTGEETTTTPSDSTAGGGDASE